MESIFVSVCLKTVGFVVIALLDGTRTYPLYPEETPWTKTDCPTGKEISKQITHCMKVKVQKKKKNEHMLLKKTKKKETNSYRIKRLVHRLPICKLVIHNTCYFWEYSFLSCTYIQCSCTLKPKTYFGETIVN